MAVQEISPAEVKARLASADGRFVLLDCREADELQTARIEGAMHIPMGEVAKQLGRLDPAKEIVVFCHHGKRSANVAEFLTKQNYANVRSMRGGIDAWSVEIDPRVTRY
jgi:rhodanese-related sulfurtransferase